MKKQKTSVEVLKKLRDIGYSYRHIAYLTGLSYATVVSKLKGYREKANFNNIDEELEKKIICAFNDRKSITAIAIAFNVRASDVLKIVKNHQEMETLSRR